MIHLILKKLFKKRKEQNREMLDSILQEARSGWTAQQLDDIAKEI